MNVQALIATRKRFIQRMGLTAGLSISIPLAAFAGASSSAANSVPSAPMSVDDSISCAVPAPTAATLKAYLDPDTGRFIVPPEHAQDAEPLTTMPERAPTATEALVERPAPGGGMALDLDQRFLSFSTATKDQDGNLAISHTPLPTSK